MWDRGIEMRINWESFAAYNHDARGIQFKFEDLCRQLFANENLSENKQFRYLHANPNNHGLETEPVYDETNKRWIGFQAKFFDHDVDSTRRRSTWATPTTRFAKWKSVLAST